MILAEEMIWKETTRILDGKIVTCFTHYKVNLKQTLELVEEAFRKPYFATIAISESRTCIRCVGLTIKNCQIKIIYGLCVPRTNVSKKSNIYSATYNNPKIHVVLN